VGTARLQVGGEGAGGSGRERNESSFVLGTGTFERHDPDIRARDHVCWKVIHPLLDEFGPADTFSEHPDHGVVPGIRKVVRSPAAGDLKQVLDERPPVAVVPRPQPCAELADHQP
jgi:hypothetical protein